MTSFLARFYDPELDVSPIESREELDRRQIERVSRALSVVIIAGMTPRRLGGDATDEELALDKKRARRAGHALGQSLKQWTKRKQNLPNDDGVRMEGAQINWESWAEAHISELQQQLRCVTTYALRSNEERWGKSAVVRLENELKWLQIALRD